jgi:hypothetical protein
MQILTLDKYKQPLTWVDWQTAVIYQAKDMVLWTQGEIVFTAHGGKNRFTGEQSVIRVPSIMSIDNEAYVKYREPVLTNKNLFRRDLHLCAYCGHQFEDALLTRDHVHPTSRGGKNKWTNCVTSCKKCNNYKDDMTLDEIRSNKDMVDMELLYLPYTPNQYEALILRNRKILADQMDFLVKYLPEESRASKLI